MSKSGGTTRTVSQTNPASFQQPYVNEMLSEAQRLYGTGGPQLYGGSFTAPFTLPEVRAQEGVQNTAFPATQEIADWSQQAFAWNLNQGRDPTNNPFLTQSMDAAIRPVFQALNESTLPQLRGGYRLGGSPGGSRQALAEANAVDATTRNALDATTSIYNNAWNTGQQQALQTLSLGPTIQQEWVQPYSVLSDVGAQQRSYEQSLIDEARYRSDYSQNLPYTQLAEYSNLLRQPWGSIGTSEVVSPESSTASQIAAGALTLPAIISLIRSIFG